MGKIEEAIMGRVFEKLKTRLMGWKISFHLHGELHKISLFGPRVRGGIHVNRQIYITCQDGCLVFDVFCPTKQQAIDWDHDHTEKFSYLLADPGMLDALDKWLISFVENLVQQVS